MSQYEKRKRKRRNCVEGIIGHMKTDGRMGRNFLSGEEGDRAECCVMWGRTKHEEIDERDTRMS